MQNRTGFGIRFQTGLALPCVLFYICVLAARANEQVLRSFDYLQGGSPPVGGLIQGVDDALYGVFGSGAVFKIKRDGTALTNVYCFGTRANDVTNPAGPLLLGADRALYGVSAGGGDGAGALFKVNSDGTDYTLLYSFGDVTNDGVGPQAPLLQGKEGFLYGTTVRGGADNIGTIFRINTNGRNYSILHSFSGGPKDGMYPEAALVQGKDGALYGTTRSGGINELVGNIGSGGTVFKLNVDGTGFALLHSFPESTNDGNWPEAALLQGSDGCFYGSTTLGGDFAAGTVFRLDPDGADYKVLHSFDDHVFNGYLLGIAPRTALAQGSDGMLYGTTSMDPFQRPGTVFCLNPNGTDYALVHVFGSFSGDGLDPQGPLLLARDGFWYGTTAYGGGSGQGTMFRLTSLQVAPFVMHISQLPSGDSQIDFEGITGATYILYASTNLSDWVSIGSVFNESGLVEFLDVNATKSAQRYYRARSIP